MKHLRNQLILLVVAAICALLLVQYLRVLQPAQARSVRAACNGMRPSPTNPIFGDLSQSVTATEFKLEDSDGNQVSLSDFRGEIVIVNFWASWCSVCRSEKPSLERFQSEYPRDTVRVLAVASDRDWAPVRRAMMGFDVATANEILAAPGTYGIRNPKKLGAKGEEVIVSRIDRDRPASKGGLHRLDRIISLNGSPVASKEALDKVLQSASGDMSIVVSRNGSSKSLTLSKNKKLRVLLDRPSDDGNLGAIAKSYGITAVPESFVVDKDGKIRHYFINKRNWSGDIAETCMRGLTDG